jgi:hypothetical protein
MAENRHTFCAILIIRKHNIHKKMNLIGKQFFSYMYQCIDKLCKLACNSALCICFMNVFHVHVIVFLFCYVS